MKRPLDISGVGFKAAGRGQLMLSLGSLIDHLSHAQGIKATVDAKQTQITLQGYR